MNTDKYEEYLMSTKLDKEWYDVKRQVVEFCNIVSATGYDVNSQMQRNNITKFKKTFFAFRRNNNKFERLGTGHLGSQIFHCMLAGIELTKQKNALENMNKSKDISNRNLQDELKKQKEVIASDENKQANLKLEKLLAERCGEIRELREALEQKNSIIVAHETKINELQTTICDKLAKLKFTGRPKEEKEKKELKEYSICISENSCNSEDEGRTADLDLKKDGIAYYGENEFGRWYKKNGQLFVTRTLGTNPENESKAWFQREQFRESNGTIDPDMITEL
jgi:hypothetical protein